MKVYIVIVTFNGIAWIDKCLNSIYNGYNIVVTDNNSTDNTVQFIKENYPQVTILPQSKNLGFGAANNIGISHALKQGAEYVFLLNQDAYLEVNTIETLINIHKENKEYGILSPVHLNGNGDKLDFNFSHYLFRNKEILFDSLQNKYTKTIYEVPFVNAAAWLLPKETLLNIGGFDPIFHHYAEDDNYCQRTLFHNLKIGVVPNTYVFHDREFRKNTAVETINEKLKRQELFFKHQWANINIEIEGDVIKTKQKLKKLILKLIIKLKFSKANYYRKELNLLDTIIPEILKSRQINSKVGKHYIA